ncbi:MAG: hypothetical protein AAF590_04200 [Pseudomonadota bacterium]
MKAITGPTFDRDKKLVFIPGALANLEDHHILIGSLSLALMIVGAGLYDDANVLAVSLFGVLAFFTLGILVNLAREYDRRFPSLLINGEQICIRHGFLAKTVPWSNVSEISQTLSQDGVSLVFHTTSGTGLTMYIDSFRRKERDRLLFILKNICRQRGAMWSVFEPSEWNSQKDDHEV